MEHPITNPESENWLALAEELDQLQAKENDGRGVDCVRTIIMYLRDGNVNKAKAVCYNEGDKIRNYPTIVDWLEKNIVHEPWLDFKRMQEFRKQKGI